MMVSVRCTGAALCRSASLLQPPYVMFLCGGMCVDALSLLSPFKRYINTYIDQ